MESLAQVDLVDDTHEHGPNGAGVGGQGGMEMETGSSEGDHRQFGITTRALARFCHGCGICPYAARRPGTPFEKVMRWHRTWCPAWAAHTKVYGAKALT